MNRQEDIIKSVLHALSTYVSLSPDATEQIISRVYIQHLKKDDFFVREEQVCKKIGFVYTGMIRHYYSTEKEEITRWVTLPGNFCCSLFSFIRQKPSFENLQAIEDTTLVIIDRKFWELLLSSYPEFKEIWIKNMEENYLGMEERVFYLISKSAEERYNHLLNTNPEFIQKVPLQYLASMLGTSPRHLSRIRKSISSY